MCSLHLERIQEHSESIRETKIKMQNMYKQAIDKDTWERRIGCGRRGG